MQNQNYTELKEDMNSKQLKGDGWSSFPYFLFNVIILLPIWLAMIMPLTILNIIWQKICSLVFNKPRINRESLPDFIASNKLEPSLRKFDLVLYGATGFTGKLCASYLSSKRCSEKFKWAIAGRSQSRLQDLINEMNLGDVDIIVADSSDVQALTQLVNSTRVVLSTAGPFAQFGTNLVGLCAAYGTHYCDITGEVAWIRQMIEKYDESAFKSGACIVNCCALDSIPWDIATLRAANELKKQQQNLSKIVFYDKINGEFSGGTFATLLNSLENPPPKSQLGFDPLLKQQGVREKVDQKWRARIQRTLNYDRRVQSWVGLWGLADGNAAIVRRSNILNNYNSSLEYSEYCIFPNFMQGFNFYAYIIWTASFLANSWLKNTYYRFCMRQPGEGPDKQEMDNGFMILTGFAEGSQGAKIKLTFTLPDDPGYRDTARMACESALCLALNQSDLIKKGGFLTPASCQGEALIKRLIQTGSTLQTQLEN